MKIANKNIALVLLAYIFRSIPVHFPATYKA